MNRTVILQTNCNTLEAERGVSDISERGVEQKRDMENPDWSDY